MLFVLLSILRPAEICHYHWCHRFNEVSPLLHYNSRLQKASTCVIARGT